MDKYDIKEVDKWVAPSVDDDTAKIISMPNVPKPLHSQAPRVILGSSTWDRMRKRCYYDAEYKCEVCGCEPEKGRLEAHELYSYDYTNYTAKFERCVALCKTCVDEETEVLTERGWKKIPEVTIDERVACWDRDTNIINFQNPSNTIVSHKDTAIQLTYKKTGQTMIYSQDHRIPIRSEMQLRSSYKTIRDVLAGDYNPSHNYSWVVCGSGEGDGSLSIDERVYIAIEADGNLTWDKEHPRQSTDGKRSRAYNSRYGSEGFRYTYVVRLEKHRKRARLEMLLNKSDLKWEKKSEGLYTIWTNVECKEFASAFSWSMPENKALEFIEELTFWDGTFDKGTARFYSSRKSEVDFVQSVAVQCGVRASVSVVNRIGDLHKFPDMVVVTDKLSYAVTFLSVKPSPRTDQFVKSEVSWDKDMYCLTVPTTYFVARRDGFVFITGNCHTEPGVHTGRALSMLRNNNVLMPAGKILDGLESLFKIVYEYNTQRKPADEDDLRLYGTLIGYTKNSRIGEQVDALIQKYNIKFYGPPANGEGWGKWKLIIGNREYPCKFNSVEEWEGAMAKNNAPKQAQTRPKTADDVAVEKMFAELGIG